MNTILAVDAGGTKTRGVLLDTENRILLEAVTGCGNLALEYAIGEANILDAVRRCMPEAKPEAVITGAAGGGTGTYAAQLQKKLEETFGIPALVVTDGVLAIYGALEEKNGLLVVSGTGSIVQGKKENQMYRCGGWGHLLGEYGSGAHIGYSLITRLLQCRDRQCPDPVLEDAVYRTLGVSDCSALTAYVYSHPKADIAKLAGTADALACAGNRNGAELLDAEAGELAYWTAELYCQLGFHTEEIHTSGGCIGNLPYFRHRYTEEIRQKLPEAVLCTKAFDPTAGAWTLYRNSGWNHISHAADCKTIEKGNAAFLKESLAKNFKKVMG